MALLNAAEARSGDTGRVSAYAYFALAVLTATSILNYLDRYILSILAQSIKGDLHLTDAQLGFLLGTGFAVFYAVVGIAMGRIADAVSRTRLMALGIAGWSVMTALGATATSFAGLAGTRIGVGVGEATANPASHSLISEMFPPRMRSVVLGTYVAGSFLGGAAAMVVGGLIVQHWTGICQAVPGGAACGLKGWQGALIAVGALGLPLAAVVAFLREPPRPYLEDVSLGPLCVREFSAALPPFTLVALARSGNARAFTANLALIVAVVLAAWALIAVTGDIAQWSAIALGAYCVISWGQAQKLRDRPFYSLTFGDPTYVLAMLSGAFVACATGAVSAWAAPYAMRELHMSSAAGGAALGLIAAVCGGIAVIAAGWITDRWKRSDPRAPIWMATVALTGTLPPLVVMMSTHSVAVYLSAYAVFAIFQSGWAGGYAALIQDLVLPRMRGSAASAFTLVNIVIAAGAGPYWAGKVSTVTGSLGTGILSVQLLAPVAYVILFLAARRLRSETPAGRRARAEAAGEQIVD
jgi:MFS family permease